jgi:predicted AAA+ superfamily ATPase
MIPRHLSEHLRRSAEQFPVVSLTGPRQSGKTTLVRNEFSDYNYVSLELPDQRAFALEDPRGFFSQFSGPVILDEVQRAPDLFSYIQVFADELNKPGHFILTGSHNFLLMQQISQTLAGRCAVLHLMPFSLTELLRREPFRLETTRLADSALPLPEMGLEQMLFTGFYPRIHDQGLSAKQWLGSYYLTYLERDVRNVLKVGDLETFGRFILLCAGRSGQLLNLSGLAGDCGITHTTAKRWLSILEASFLVLLLRPHYRNFGKRLVKSPKLYFLDTGLLCHLLRVQSDQELHHHSLRGSIFESFVISEFYKYYCHMGQRPPLYFWRDAAGREIDMLIDMGQQQIPFEIKSAKTIASDFFDQLNYWRLLAGRPDGPAFLIYGGDTSMKRQNVQVVPWFFI